MKKLASQISVGPPAWVTVMLAVLATGLQVINEVALAGHAQTQAIVAVVLVFLVGVGIKPLTGRGLAAIVHLPDWLATLLSAVAAALAGALQAVGMSTTAHTVTIAIVTFLAALGFGGTTPVAVGAVAQHRKVRRA